MPQEADGTLYGNPDDSITITCTVENDAAIEVYWYKDNVAISNDFAETIDGTSVTSGYIISSLSVSDDGVYSCSLDTDGETQVSEQSVTLQTQGRDCISMSILYIYRFFIKLTTTKTSICLYVLYINNVLNIYLSYILQVYQGTRELSTSMLVILLHSPVL